jgi:hypothetical protein
LRREAACLSADFSVNVQGNQNRQSVGNLSFYETKKDGLTGWWQPVAMKPILKDL